VLLIKLLPCILFEKYIYILALEMACPGNQHCANCIGTLSFPILPDERLKRAGLDLVGGRLGPSLIVGH